MSRSCSACERAADVETLQNLMVEIENATTQQQHCDADLQCAFWKTSQFLETERGTISGITWQ